MTAKARRVGVVVVIMTAVIALGLAVRPAIGEGGTDPPQTLHRGGLPSRILPAAMPQSKPRRLRSLPATDGAPAENTPTGAPAHTEA